MSSEVFFLSWARDHQPAGAVRRALELASLQPGRIEDAFVGFDPPYAPPDLEQVMRSAGLDCPAVGISPALRAVSLAAASLLCDDVALAAVLGPEPAGCVALLLASAEAIGRLNLLPSARLAARSGTGPARALQLAGMSANDVQLHRTGSGLPGFVGLLDDLEARSARWGLVSSAELSLLVERI